jgi:hypothetical protein
MLTGGTTNLRVNDLRQSERIVPLTSWFEPIFWSSLPPWDSLWPVRIPSSEEGGGERKALRSHCGRFRCLDSFSFKERRTCYATSSMALPRV